MDLFLSAVLGVTTQCISASPPKDFPWRLRVGLMFTGYYFRLFRSVTKWAGRAPEHDVVGDIRLDKGVERGY